MNVLVLGSTGYVGGRLVPRLLKAGHHVRAAGRSLQKLNDRQWAHEPGVELSQVDVMDVESLKAACQGCDVVYYLVHSMNASAHDFENTDRIAASHMVQAAEQSDVKRIIYLGGLGEESDVGLSLHLKSRREVGEVLQSGRVPVTTFRAAMIIGSGSASFEILRYLVEHLPIMVTPKWVHTRNQPIAVRNVLTYLVGCLEVPETTGQYFDIGGRDVVTYRELMDIYAEEAGLSKRWVVPVPVLTPMLSSLWIHLVTPVPSSIARPLTEGLCNEVVCHDNRVRDLIPQDDLFSAREAIGLALKHVHGGQIDTHWADAGQTPMEARILKGDPAWAGGTMLEDKRHVKVEASVEEVWSVIVRIGGQTGWYHADWLWALRGGLDRMIGGVGLRRGRRHPYDIATGDALDFWRVVAVEPNRQLLLTAEMKLPGTATLEFLITEENGYTQLTQTALFQPRGLFGLLYWYCVYVLHHYVFGGMIYHIKKTAEKHNPPLN